MNGHDKSNNLVWTIPLLIDGLWPSKELKDFVKFLTEEL